MRRFIYLVIAVSAITGFGQRSIVMSFVPPRALEVLGPGKEYNDVLLARDDGHVRSL